MIIDQDGRKFFNEPSLAFFWYLVWERFVYPWTSNFLLWSLVLEDKIPPMWFFDDVFYQAFDSPFDENYFILFGEDEYYDEDTN